MKKQKLKLWVGYDGCFVFSDAPLIRGTIESDGEQIPIWERSKKYEKHGGCLDGFDGAVEALVALLGLGEMQDVMLDVTVTRPPTPVRRKR
jgi:hypothetical protein